MANIAYIRTSSVQQQYDRQEAILAEYPIDKYFREKVSGAIDERTELNKMLSYVRSGDTLYIESLSRLGRRLSFLLEIVSILNEKDVALVSIKESFIDTTTPQGKLIFGIFATLSEFERETIKERQKEGIAIAKAKGKYRGRKRIDVDYNDDFKRRYKLWKSGELKSKDFMQSLKLSKTTFYSKIAEFEKLIIKPQ